MRHIGLGLLALWIGGCGFGKDGEPGGFGSPSFCEARMEEGLWKVSCPDGTSVEVAPGACDELPGEGGTWIIRCDDGTEAIVDPGDKAPFGAVKGRVVLGHPSRSADVMVQVLGTDLATHCQPDGTFLLEGIPAGRYTVEASFGSYEPVRVEDVLILRGTLDLGTLRLDAYRWIDGSVPLSINQEGQLLVEMGDAPLLRDLVTGTSELLTAPNGGMVQLIFWTGPDSLVLYSPSQTPPAFGFWSRGGGTTWLEGLEPALFAPQGVIGFRAGEDGTTAPWFLGKNQTVPLAVPPTSRIHALGLSGRSLAIHEDGTFLVDVTSGTPAIRRLADGNPSSFVLDANGRYVVLTSTNGVTQLVQLDPPHRSVPVPQDVVGWIFEEAIARWVTRDGTWSWYDGETGRSHVGEPGETAAWSPGLRWFWIREPDGTTWIEKREGGFSLSLSLGSWDALRFSPDATKVLVVGPGPEMTAIELSEGEKRSDFPAGLESCFWIDDEHLFCEDGTDRVVVSTKGTFTDLGQPLDHRLEEDRFLLQDASGQWHVWREDVSAFRRIGSAGEVLPIPGGEALIVWTEGGRVYHFTPETGEKLPIASEVLSPPMVMKECLLYRGLHEGQESWIHTTYPR